MAAVLGMINIILLLFIIVLLQDSVLIQCESGLEKEKEMGWGPSGILMFFFPNCSKQLSMERIVCVGGIAQRSTRRGK